MTNDEDELCPPRILPLFLVEFPSRRGPVDCRRRWFPIKSGISSLRAAAVDPIALVPFVCHDEVLLRRTTKSPRRRRRGCRPRRPPFMAPWSVCSRRRQEVEHQKNAPRPTEKRSALDTRRAKARTCVACHFVYRSEDSPAQVEKFDARCLRDAFAEMLLGVAEYQMNALRVQSLHADRVLFVCPPRRPGDVSPPGR